MSPLPSHPFQSILLPLDGSPESAKGAGCALWLAQALGATLHVLHATPHPLPAQDVLAQLRAPQVRGARVVVHQRGDDPQAATLAVIEAQHIDLVVMRAVGASASTRPTLVQRLGRIAQAIIERSPVPVVLLPTHYRESLPWRSMLVAASGEAAADRALESAARLAKALQLQVTVVHSNDGPDGPGPAPLGSYADSPQYEIPHRLEWMVERGLASCTAEEAGCVHEMLLRRGEPGAVLLDQVAHEGSSVLALGWHGGLGAGRALVLKRLLEEASCALLLVREPQGRGARLKVGTEFDEQ